MKKNIFSILILTLVTALFSVLLAAIFTACAEGPSGKEYEDDNLPDYKISSDWKYVSIYLDGKDAPISVNTSKNTTKARSTAQNAARAMTPDTARRGFDYFEVFFYYKGTVARSAWEIGKKASIMDVYRTDSGIDYSLTSIYTTAGGVAGSAPAGQSAIGVPAEVSPTNAASILFAGRKSDKTLLAVGKLVSVDVEEPADGGFFRNTVVSNSTVFVTFELSPFTANTSAEIAKSSFLTDNTGGNSPSAVNTKVINALIGEKRFPLYVLPGGKPSINAQYTLGMDGEWSDFSGSVLVMSEGIADKRQARYPAGGGQYYYAKYAEDQTTVIRMTNNQSSWSKGAANTLELQNPLTFVIDTSKTVNSDKNENGIFSFVFEIPVYPLSSDIPKNYDDCWYIRPAYQSYNYNIDNGVTTGEYTDKNIGGAVLCGVDIQAEDFEISAVRR